MKKKERSKRGTNPCFFTCRLEVELGKGEAVRVLVCGVDKMVGYSKGGIAFHLKNKKNVEFLGEDLVCNTLYSGASEVVGEIQSIEFSEGVKK